MVKDIAKEALAAVPSGMAVRLLGIDRQALYGMLKRGEIKAEQTHSGRHLWNVGEYLARKKRKAA